MSLLNRFKAWLVVKAITEGFERLEAQHLGRLLDAALDAKYSSKDSEQMQARLVGWLRSLITELEEDRVHDPRID